MICNLNKINSSKKIFVFDFDGVIADTNKLKMNTFLECIDGDNNKKNFYIFNLKNINLESEKKFFYFYKEILKNKDYEILSNKKNILYNKILLKKIQNIKINPNISNYLKLLKRRNKKMFIVSSASSEFVKKFLIKKKINNFFHKILTKPKSKKENFNTLFKLFNKNLSVYFGDTYSDYSICKSINLDFILVKKYSIDKKAINLSSNTRVLSINNFK